MKKRFCWNVILLVAVIIFSSFVPSAASEKKVVAQDNPFKYEQSRFANMLNHNFVYGQDFDSAEDIINNSLLALLNLSEDGEFIAKQYVDGFVSDMYGVEIDNSSSINADFPQKDGYYYIIPRGYTTYAHQVTNITKNEDGSFRVQSTVKVSAHDSEEETLFATSLFVKNECSSFGYNLISCDIY